MGITAQCVHGVGMCFLPHQQNGHRPWLLRRGVLTLLAAFLLVLKISALGLLSLLPAQAQLATITPEKIIDLTNAERTRAGLIPLKVNSRLNQAAAAKATHMLEKDYFAHVSPDGVTPWFWFGQSGYAYAIAGENLAIDFFAPADTVKAWMNSPTHRANILHAEYQETGVGVVPGEFQGGTSIVVVHLFARPLTPLPTTISPSSPQPSPAPVLSAITKADTDPPITPRLWLTSDNTTVSDQVTVGVQGEGGALVHLLLNDKVQPAFTLPESGTLTPLVPLNGIPDGQFTLSAYSVDAAGNRSELAESFTLQKDTVAPTTEAKEFSFLLSPTPDTPEILLKNPLPSQHALTIIQGAQRIHTSAPLVAFPLMERKMELNITDEAGNSTKIATSLGPQFSQERLVALDGAHRLLMISQWLALSIAVLVTIILMITVIVRMHWHHAGVIAHSSLLILLALSLFLL